MASDLKHTEGVILKVIPFGAYDQEIFLFTRDAGLLKVMYKNGQRGQKKSFFSPLAVAEVVYRERNSEISYCHDLTLIEHYNGLRKSLRHLEVGCDLIQVITSSQVVGEIAPALYELLRYYLNKIPTLPDPEVLSISFRLKLLLHDGLLSIPLVCGVCEALLQDDAFLHGFEWFCNSHRLPGSVTFNDEEIQILYQLGCAQSFRVIASCVLTPMVKIKVVDLFKVLTHMR